MESLVWCFKPGKGREVVGGACPLRLRGKVAEKDETKVGVYIICQRQGDRSRGLGLRQEMPLKAVNKSESSQDVCEHTAAGLYGAALCSRMHGGNVQPARLGAISQIAV